MIHKVVPSFGNTIIINKVDDMELCIICKKGIIEQKALNKEFPSYPPNIFFKLVNKS